LWNSGQLPAIACSSPSYEVKAAVQQTNVPLSQYQLSSSQWLAHTNVLPDTSAKMRPKIPHPL
jgi:hypothetical protein